MSNWGGGHCFPEACSPRVCSALHVGVSLWGPHSKDYSLLTFILGSILGNYHVAACGWSACREI